MAADGGLDPRPLFSIEAEQAVLGGLLLANDAWDRIAGTITGEDFSTGDHRRIFQEIAALIAARRGADVLTVSEALKASGGLRDEQGLHYLHQLAYGTPSAANIVRYAEIVRDRATLRRLANAARKLADLVNEPNGLAAIDVLNRTQEALSRIATASTKGRGELALMAEHLTRTMEELEEAFRNREKRGSSGISTGFAELDEKIGGGLKPGQLIVIAGRPGMGKSAIALNMLEHVVLTQGLAGAIFSMEMHATQLAKRLLAGLARVHGLRLAHGRIDNATWDDIGRAVPKLQEAQLYLCEDGALTIGEIVSGLRKQKRLNPALSLAVVDYLGLMGIEHPTSNRAQDLAQISRGLKGLAKDLGIPIILLAQLNREVEKRGDKRPVLSDLRDSGEIEADADLVLMLYREAVYKELDEHDPDRPRAEVLVRKQRDGPVGKVILHYADWCTRFSDWNPQ